MKTADKEQVLELLKDKNGILSRYTATAATYQRLTADTGTYIVGYNVFNSLLEQSLIEKSKSQSNPWLKTDYVIAN